MKFSSFTSRVSFESLTLSLVTLTSTLIRGSLETQQPFTISHQVCLINPFLFAMTEKRRPTSLEERNPAINKTPRLKMDTPSGGNEFKAIQKKEVSDNRTRMFLSIDYGTKTLSVAFRFLRPNEIPNLTNVITLELSKNEQLQPQIVAWAADGTFHWGSELDSRVKSTDPDYSIPAEDVIDLWKLVLYQQHKDSDMGKRVLSKLKKAEKKLSELLTTHFSAIVAKSREALKRDVRVMLEFSDEVTNLWEVKAANRHLADSTISSKSTPWRSKCSSASRRCGKLPQIVS